MIPIARPDLGQEEIDAVTDVLKGGMIAQGRRVKELEDAWAAYVGVKHAVAMGNGTLALMAIFAGIGLGPGDEVITVSHTFAATANAILFTGATPVFVDIDPGTYLIDARRNEAAITPRT
jgi:perosamine synthetase